ncbi:MAG: ankyrin repeat domain-containing protein [Proteobacteria bacterium]|nr:ankyrin repeat domain-containing protein [Pseudomonadota bacterium]
MKNLLNFALFTMAIIRSVSSGKTMMVSNFPETDEKEKFSNYFSSFFEKNPDKVTHIENPLHINQISLELSSGKYDTIVVNTHGTESQTAEEVPIMNINLEVLITLNDILKEINSANNAFLNQIHLSSCFIGKNVNQLFNPQSYYYRELNQNLQNNQLLFLHGDEYTGIIAQSYGDRLPHLITNKEYSIIEAFLDSGEGLNVIFKKDDQLKVFVAKTFGRNGEEWTLENYRSYLQQAAADAKKFEVENDILSADAKRPDIENLSDEELTKSMGDVFISYFIKLLDKKDFDRIFKLIDKIPNLDLQDKEGCTALMVAISRGHSDVAQSLINKGAKLDLQNKSGETALMIAMNRDHLDVVRFLIEKGAGLDLKNKSGWTTSMQNFFHRNLRDASKTKDLFKIAYAIHDKGIKVELTPEFLEKSFMVALQKNIVDAKQINFLLEQGVKIDAEKSETLLKAVNLNPKENAHLVNFLDAKKDAKNIESKLTKKALLWVAIEFAGHKNFQTAKSILKKRLSDQNLPKNSLGTKENSEFLNSQDSKGYSLLMYAAQKGDIELTNLLLKSGASIGLTNKEGESAYKIAKENQHEEIAEEIIAVHRKTGEDYHPEILFGVLVAAEGPIFAQPLKDQKTKVRD